tara:strand:- start:28747 stop:30114 length:1368 start_codon:yes stop_codon:yes gene_type:complete
MSNKSFSLSGMPDLSSIEVKKREYVLNVMKKIFEKYGFQPLETPAIEKREVLIGNYGSDADKLVYQLLKSGDFLSKVDSQLLNSDYNTLSSVISDKALRYDLTIPFARYISKNQSSINFPYKRYQMQKVWRADRPQKGRLREFTQCDADIIGSDSHWLEIDLIKVYDEVFFDLGLENVILKINNRKILEGLFKIFSSDLKFTEFCIALDKIEKKGKNYFIDFLKKNKVSKKNILLFELLLKQSISINDLDSFFSKKIKSKNDFIDQGVSDTIAVFSRLGNLKCLKIEFDLSLARGLNYYTGLIFEVLNSKVSIGSIGGGGRYDNLTSIFGKNIGSGAGISFGLERIIICLNELNLFPKFLYDSLDVLFVNLGDKEAILSQNYIDKLRSFNYSCELYPDNVKLKKQLSYANKRNVRYIAIIGEDELKSNKITLKNMSNGDQHKLNFNDLINFFKNE